ncbi:hypothetical protein OU798_07335 [Prolixibacteraceae bacterium Z1-6]|uniref:Fibrobacter succinogenes major paralogous domain-containing protein n=1 Tax=Draconibacterium aestuarii TaxID=2998507 RepID=A0A9X3J479_9BACT|nr:hypothetical protein [Prolixibacteraceae bacterium Z1-6]
MTASKRDLKRMFRGDHRMSLLIDRLFWGDRDTLVRQIGHGFAVGTAIRRVESLFLKARAIDFENAKTIGVVSKVHNANTFSYRNEGLITDPQFEDGKTYMLSPTVPGLITTIADDYNWQPGMVKQLIGHGTSLGLELEIDAGHVVNELSDEIADIVTTTVNEILNEGDTLTQQFFNFLGGFKYADYSITAATSESYTTVWKAELLNERLGEFKVQVFIHDTSDDSKFHLQAILGFDHLDTGNKQSKQSNVLTDSPVTLTLSINPTTNFLEAALAGMPANVKNIHYCFERCILADNQMAAAEAEFVIEGDADTSAYLNLEATADFELDGEAELSNYAELGDYAEFELDGEAEINGGANLESEAIIELEGEAELSDANSADYPVADYGTLYNFPAIEDVRNMAPTGYRVARLTDVVDLLTYLGGETVAGGKLKATTVWTAPNTGATNEKGFAALPAGTRNELGAFADKLLKGKIWIDNR